MLDSTSETWKKLLWWMVDDGRACQHQDLLTGRGFLQLTVRRQAWLCRDSLIERVFFQLEDKSQYDLLALPGGKRLSMNTSLQNLAYKFGLDCEPISCWQLETQNSSHYYLVPHCNCCNCHMDILHVKLPTYMAGNLSLFKWVENNLIVSDSEN